MNFKVTLVLLALLAALGGYFYYFEVVLHEKEQTKELSDKRMFDINAAEVRFVRIEKPGETAIELTRESGQWEMVKPVSAAGDTELMNGIVASLTTLNVEQKLDDVAMDNLQPFGLDPALATVTLGKAGGQDAVTVLVGNQNPTQTFAYARKGKDQPLVLTANTIRTQVLNEAKHFRQKKLFPNVQVNDYAAFEIVNEGGAEFSLELRPPADWFLTKPKEVRANQTKVREIMDAMSTAAITNFVVEEATDEDLAKYRLAQPDRTLVMTYGTDKKVVTISYGQRDLDHGLVAVKLSDSKRIVQLPMGFYNALDLKLEDLREKKVVNLTQAEVKKITLNLPDSRLVFTSDGGTTWHMVEPEDILGDTGNITNTMSIFNREEAIEVIETPDPGKDYGLNPPGITATYRQGDVNITVGFGKTEGGKVYVRNMAFPEISVMNDSVLTAFRQPPFHFRNKLIFTFQRSDAEKLEFLGPNGLHIVMKKGGEMGTYDVVEPKEVPGDNMKVNTMLNSLSYVNMTDIVSDTANNLEQYGLEKPLYTFNFFRPDGTKGSLFLGTELPEENKVYAWTGNGGIYKISRTVQNAIPKQISEVAADEE